MDGMVMQLTDYGKKVMEGIIMGKKKNEDTVKLADCIAAPARKKYSVSAAKYSNTHEEFDTVEEAQEAAVRLLGEGYTSVTFHDTTGENDLW